MKFNLALPKFASRATLVAKKHSPDAMFVLGVVGTVVSTVLACRATLKLGETLDDCQFELNLVKDAYLGNPEQNTQKDVVYVYAKSAVRISRLYGSSVIVGATSIGLLTGSHVSLTRRNAGLTAAYSAMQMSFDKYRDRVQNELGEKRELELLHGVSIEETTVNGKKENQLVLDGDDLSPYSRYFDSQNPNWNKNRELTMLFIRCQETYLTHLLNSRGHVFLNEAYDALGLPRSKAGQIVGWVLNNGDNHIDFGLYTSTRNIEYLVTGDNTIVLDFNVDGIIYDLIG